MSQYDLDEMNKYETQQNEAFQALMKLIAPVNQDEAIRLWVQGTLAAKWQGRHSYAADVIASQMA